MNGLRDYGVAPSVWGGDPACRHDFRVEVVEGELRTGLGLAALSEAHYRGGGVKQGQVEAIRAERGECAQCGAWLGCLGLEPTPRMYVEHLVAILEEARRVLRDDGVLWLNLGDSYASATQKGNSGNGTSTLTSNGAYQDEAPRPWSGRPNVGASSWAGPHRGAKTRAHRDGQHAGKHGTRDGGTRMGSNRAQRGDGNDGAPYGPMIQPNRMPLPGLKPKDLIGVPWRVAFALQDAGWWLRQDMIWSKPNPMPESVTDRCTKAHEYLFMLTRRQDYYFDAAAIAEAANYAPGCGWEEEKKGARPSKRKKQERAIDPEEPFRAIRETRNKRSVWTVATKSFSGEFCRACRTYYEGAELQVLRVEKVQHPDGCVQRIRWCACGSCADWLSHFATFPPELVEDCVKATVPSGGTVLDMFGGAGTTALVADRLGRDAVIIEANPDYAEMSCQRLNRDGRMFAAATIEGGEEHLGAAQ